MSKKILVSVEVTGNLDATGNLTATNVVADTGGDVQIAAASGDPTSLADHEIMIWMGMQ